jgi:hypothetical protein
MYADMADRCAEDSVVGWSRSDLSIGDLGGVEGPRGTGVCMELWLDRAGEEDR